MDYRQLGHSGLRVSSLTLGTMTFGGRDKFAQVGTTDVEGATRQIDMCLDAGVNLIDTADVYSGGLSEEIVGRAVRGRRDRVLLATKARMPMGDGPNDAGLSRHHIIRACEASLRRMGTDYIDLYQVHEWDGATPLEETLDALDHLVDSWGQTALRWSHLRTTSRHAARREMLRSCREQEGVGGAPAPGGVERRPRRRRCARRRG